VNAPSRLDSTPLLADFPFRVTDNVRFADLDPNQHVNNAVYATYFETGRVTLMKDRSYGLMPQGLAWMMVRLDMHFRAELRWPGTIEMGLGLTKFGRTSVTFDQVVFDIGIDRRDHPQADAADGGYRPELSALAAARGRYRTADAIMTL